MSNILSNNSLERKLLKSYHGFLNAKVTLRQKFVILLYICYSTKGNHLIWVQGTESKCWLKNLVVRVWIQIRVTNSEIISGCWIY